MIRNGNRKFSSGAKKRTPERSTVRGCSVCLSGSLRSADISNGSNGRRETREMEQSPQRVTIFGVGLIGGSLALELKRSFPEIRIAGIDKPSVIDRARQLKIVEAAGVDRPDLVILATPVGEILRLLDQFTSKHSLVVDVGSTKLAICRKAERLGVPFIGGHPMAGQEQSGPEAANVDLFRDAPFFLCPVRTTPDGAVEQFRSLVKSIWAVAHLFSAAY